MLYNVDVLLHRTGIKRQMQLRERETEKQYVNGADPLSWLIKLDLLGAMLANLKV